jgi:hypothetical protein
MSTTGGMLLNEARASKPSLPRPGCVRDKWYEAEGIATTTGGSWVDTLELLERRTFGR